MLHLDLTKTKKNQGGGLSPPGNNQNRNQFACLSFGVDPLNWLSFIEIGHVARLSGALVDTLLKAFLV